MLNPLRAQAIVEKKGNCSFGSLTCWHDIAFSHVLLIFFFWRQQKYLAALISWQKVSTKIYSKKVFLVPGFFSPDSPPIFLGEFGSICIKYKLLKQRHPQWTIRSPIIMSHTVFVIGCWWMLLLVIGCNRLLPYLRIGCDWMVLLVVDSKRLILTMIGYYRLLLPVIGYYRLILFVIGCGWMTLLVIGCNRFRLLVIGCGRMVLLEIGCIRFP